MICNSQQTLAGFPVSCAAAGSDLDAKKKMKKDDFPVDNAKRLAYCMRQMVGPEAHLGAKA